MQRRNEEPESVGLRGEMKSDEGSRKDEKEEKMQKNEARNKGSSIKHLGLRPEGVITQHKIKYWLQINTSNPLKTHSSLSAVAAGVKKLR